MNSVTYYDSHTSGLNWSRRVFYGDYPLNPAPAYSLVRDTWYSLMPINPASGVNSIKVTTSANLASGKIEFALANGKTMPNQPVFTELREVLATVIADIDIATAVTNSDAAWGAMFTVGNPTEYTWRELQSLLTGFKEEYWSCLYLVYKITGAAVPANFYTKFVIEGYGENAS